jgi:hypothetical protein
MHHQKEVWKGKVSLVHCTWETTSLPNPRQKLFIVLNNATKLLWFDVVFDDNDEYLNCPCGLPWKWLDANCIIWLKKCKINDSSITLIFIQQYLMVNVNNTNDNYIGLPDLGWWSLKQKNGTFKQWSYIAIG